MNEKKTVTVAGVPVTIVVVGRELAVQVGRFDPQAAAGRLRVHPLSGTAAVAVYVAGEGGPGGLGERWVAGLYPAAPGAAEQQLLLRRLPPGRHRPARRMPGRLPARRS